MKTSVKAPKNQEADYDYIAFSFKGMHSYEDFGIYRISDSKEGYQEKLTADINTVAEEAPGRDGSYYLSSWLKGQTFQVNFAFDDLTEVKLQKLRKWLNGSGDQLEVLWFAEAPHKIYLAKVTGKPEIKTIAFSTPQGRVYKGTGTVQFSSFYPYACTPDVITIDIDGTEEELPGNWHTSYARFSNYESLLHTLPLANEEMGYGNMDFHFVASLISPSSDNRSLLTVNTNGITLELSGVKEEQIVRTGDQLDGYQYTYDLEAQDG